jgi:hypothetical protein
MAALNWAAYWRNMSPGTMSASSSSEYGFSINVLLSAKNSASGTILSVR